MLNFYEVTLLDANGTNRAVLGTAYTDNVLTGYEETRSNDGDETTLWSGRNSVGLSDRCTYWTLDLTSTYSLAYTDIHSLVVHNRWAQSMMGAER
jgi:hypothetical protein